MAVPAPAPRFSATPAELVAVMDRLSVMEESLGPGGRTALRGRGGSVFRVVRGGVLRVGDAVAH